MLQQAINRDAAWCYKVGIQIYTQESEYQECSLSINTPKSANKQMPCVERVSILNKTMPVVRRCANNHTISYKDACKYRLAR